MSMTPVLIVLYLAGWIGTTVLLLRRDFAADEQGRGQQAVLGVVGVLCAIALASVWPLSGWLLPMIRAALHNPD